MWQRLNDLATVGSFVIGVIFLVEYFKKPKKAKKFIDKI